MRTPLLALKRPTPAKFTLMKSNSFPVSTTSGDVRGPASTRSAARGKPVAVDTPLPPSLVAWLGALQQAEFAAVEAYPEDVRERLIYLFKVKPRPRGAPELHVELISTRILTDVPKNGAFSTSTSHTSLSSILSNYAPKYLRPSDVRIARKLDTSNRAVSFANELRLKGEDAWEIIDEALATGRARIGDVNGLALSDGGTRSGRIAWRLDERESLRPNLEIEKAL